MTIKEWAEKTVRIYNPIANEYNIAYYNQSPLNQDSHPKILIVGYNPGSTGNYNEIDAERLLEGNPYWYDHKNWNYTKNLYNRLNFLNLATLDNGNDCLFTNATFLGTKQINSNKNLTKILALTIPCTIELIEILQPERIVILSGKSVLPIIGKAIGSKGDFDYQHCIANLFYGRLNNIPIYGIPHTSAPLKHEEWDLTLNALQYLIENENTEFDENRFNQMLRNEIKFYEWRNKAHLISFDLEKAEKMLLSSIANIQIEHCKNTIRINNWIKKDELQVTISIENPKYIAIRHQSYKKAYSIKQDYENEQIWRAKLTAAPYHFCDKYNQSWLGQKGLAEYGNTTEEIIENLMKEIKEINNKYA